MKPGPALPNEIVVSTTTRRATERCGTVEWTPVRTKTRWAIVILIAAGFAWLPFSEAERPAPPQAGTIDVVLQGELVAFAAIEGPRLLLWSPDRTLRTQIDVRKRVPLAESPTAHLTIYSAVRHAELNRNRSVFLSKREGEALELLMELGVLVNRD
jgi:hypothetical protein